MCGLGLDGRKVLVMSMVPWQRPRDLASHASLGISILEGLKTLLHQTRWKSRRLRSVHDDWIFYVLYLYLLQSSPLGVILAAGNR